MCKKFEFNNEISSKTLLSIALQHGRLSLAKHLLSKGAAVNDGDLHTDCMLLLQGNWGEILESVLKKSPVADYLTEVAIFYGSMGHRGYQRTLIFMHMYICMYVCMYMYICRYVCILYMYVFMYISM